jgi:hypothetical protein
VTVDLRITARLVSQTETVIDPPPANVQWYKVMHDRELWNAGIRDGKLKWDWRVGLPEVQFGTPTISVEMTEAIQRLWFGLFRYGAPAMAEAMAKKKYRVIYQDDIAFCNKMGYPHGWDGGPRKDYINGLDLNKSLPVLDKPRFCGGALVRGVVSGDDLIVRTIDAENIPSLEHVIRERLYFTAVNVGPNFASAFPQGLGEPVLVPLISAEPIRYPLARLKKLPLSYDIDGHNVHLYE